MSNELFPSLPYVSVTPKFLYVSDLLTETNLFYLNLIICYITSPDYGELMTLHKIYVFYLTSYGA